MYVEVYINGKLMCIMVDKGATHNFVFVGMMKRLALNIIKEPWWLMAINSNVSPCIK